MSNYNSQEQTIYRNLAGKIQLGFYDDGARFPSAKEIAEIMHISARTVEKHIELALRELRTKLTPFLFWILVYGHITL